MKYTNLLIDLDDTIWDFHVNSNKCLEDIFYDYKFDKFYPTFQDYLDVYMPSNEQLWLLYGNGSITRDKLIIERFLVPLRKFGINDAEYAIAISDDYLNRTTEQTILVDGAIELLDYLYPKYDMHIISNGFTEVQYRKMNNSGLSEYFDKVILSEQVGVNKPHPDIFTYALEQTGSVAEETIIIGDNWQADIVGAYKSNIDQIWFNRNGESAVDFEPTHMVKSLKEITYIL